MNASGFTSRMRGRPRSFDLTEVLDRAIQLFRERGYQSASVTQLEEATQLKTGSLYKAFNNKEGLFLAALDRYLAESARQRRVALETCRTGREELRALLTLYASTSAGDQGRRGCLVMISAFELTTLDPEAAAEVRRALDRTEALVVEIMRRGQADGTLRADLNPQDAARLILSVLYGMRTLGKTGRSAYEMDALVELALRAVT